MTPLPQIGAPPPMTWACSTPSVRGRDPLRPRLSGHPMESPAPSKAGPAAVEQQESCPRCQRAISPLVPISPACGCLRLGADAAGQQRRGDVRTHKSGHTAGQIYLRMGAEWSQTPQPQAFPNRREEARGAGHRKTVRAYLREANYDIAVFPVMTSASHCFSGRYMRSSAVHSTFQCPHTRRACAGQLCLAAAVQSRPRCGR